MYSQNLFSVIIPTRQRHDTLKHSIQSVINQTHKEFELVVMDNFSSPETAEVVASFNDERIKYHRAPERLSMSDNWELGLSHATGEYITVLGDDDGLMPDCLEICLNLLNTYDVQTVAWSRGTVYWWPNAIVPWHRNKLYVRLQQVAFQFQAKQKLKQFYNFEVSYDELPMLYNAFIHRSLIEKIKSVYGKYFMSSIPDVYSGVINAYYLDNYLYSFRPLSVAGNSGHSTGTSSCYPSLGGKPFKDFLTDAKKNTKKLLHDSLVPSINPLMCVADVQVRTKELFFPVDEEIKFDILKVVRSAASSINMDIGQYETCLQEIEELAKKHKIPTSEFNISEKQTHRPQPYQGPISDGNGLITTWSINGAQAGISNVAQAAMLVWGMLPDLSFFQVNYLSKEEAITLYQNLNLKEINLIVFPEWHQPEQSLNEEFAQAIRAIVTHPDKDKMTLLVDSSQISDEDANLALSSVVMNLLMEEDLDVSDGPKISLFGPLSEIEWQALRPRLHGRIVLDHENKVALAQAKAENISVCEINKFKDLEL
ncbi:glycosyltransferase family 2 protein [Microcoleus sp. N3A4]|uniref:glycosyltransferase family 2 protein n=1 Tax=Microcoleus sp. N3A4 TaxID=3055379 RepID=UPI002FD674EF